MFKKIRVGDQIKPKYWFDWVYLLVIDLSGDDIWATDGIYTYHLTFGEVE